MKTKLQSWGFTKGHVQLLGVVVVIFAVLFYSESNINIHAMFSKAEAPKTMLTFENVQSQVLAANNPYTNNSEEDPNATQIALLNRTDDSGKVLGEATGLGTIPNAEQLFSEEQLATIPLTVIATNQISLPKYSSDLTNAESKYDTLSLLADLNSSDKQVLQNAIDKTQNLISDLKKIQTPTELVSYHKYKIMYYQTLISMGKSFVNADYGQDFKNSSTNLFSLMDKIERMKTDYTAKYNLPL